MRIVKASRGSDPNAARGDKARAKKGVWRKGEGKGRRAEWPPPVSSYSYQFPVSIVPIVSERICATASGT